MYIYIYREREREKNYYDTSCQGTGSLRAALRRRSLDLSEAPSPEI